jgi:PAS domain S-box-containing protein
MLDALTDHICLLDASGIILAVNEAWRDFAAANAPLNRNLGEGANYFSICEAATGADASIARQALDGLKAVARGDIPEFTLEYPCHSPEVQRWFELRAVRVGKSDSVRLVLTHRNVTHQKQATLALRASEERYRTVVEDQTEVICRFRADGTFLFVNEVYCRFFGKSTSELLNRKWHPVAHAEDIPGIEAALRGLSPGRPVVVIENRVFSSGGDVRWMQFVNRGFFDAEGQLREIQSVGRDITERKQAEEALKKSEARYRSLVVSSLDAVLLTGPDGRIFAANEAACRMFGRTEAELIRLGRAGVVDASDPWLAPALEARARTGHFCGELTFLRADGSKFPVEISSVIFYDPSGEPRTSMVIRDITERKRLEEERAAMLARLAMVEEQERRRLSRELHDQIAQRLVALAVELKTFETNLAAGRPQSERMGALRHAVDDLQQQVRQMAWDLRAQESLEGDLETMFREITEEWSERTHVPVDCEYRDLCSERLPPQVATPLYHIVKEALTNVEKHAQARHVSILLERDTTLVRLTVEDDGRGLDLDAIQRSPGAAQRMGLLGMKERVALAGGTFLMESSPGGGTTILVRMPINSEVK